MFYGGLKMKKNWLGTPKWYAKFKINDEIKWNKVSKKEVHKLLNEYGTRYRTEYFRISGTYKYQHKIKGKVSVDDDILFVMGESKFTTPICNSLYDEYELKLLVHPNNH